MALLAAGCHPAGHAPVTTLRGPGTHQETVTLPSGQTLRYVLVVPEKTRGSLVVALHHAGPVTAFFARRMVDTLIAPALRDPLGAVIVAPDALEGGDWRTSTNEDAVVWLTEEMLARYPIDRARVLLTGYSMGGRGTWSIGTRHQELFSALIPISASPEPAPVTIRRPICAIQSREDTVFPFEPFLRQIETIERHGVHVEVRAISGYGHYDMPLFAAPLEEAVPWLREAWGVGD